MSIHKKPITQIRLLIPTEMLHELDTIAKSRDMNRLALIRYFLRHQIDQELGQLESYLQGISRRKKTHKQLQEHLSDKERW